MGGKYDEAARRVAPLRVLLPFQTIETVNESAQQRHMALDLFSAGRNPEWRNHLIWGDKKYILLSLLSEFAGKINLVYELDPSAASPVRSIACAYALQSHINQAFANPFNCPVKPSKWPIPI